MPNKLTTRLAVYIRLQDAEGRLLLQRRVNTGYLDRHYDYACSGHVDEGEGILEAAVRELSEELGIVAAPEDLKLVHIGQNLVDTPYVNMTFDLFRWEGEPTILEPEKCDDLSYFAPDALPELCTLNVRVVQKYGVEGIVTISKVTPVEYARLMGVPA